MLQPTFNVTG